MGAVEKKPADKVALYSGDELGAIVEDAIRRALALNDQSIEYLDMEGACALLKAHSRTVRTWVAEQNLPALRAGSEYRFRKDRVIAWLESRPAKPGGHLNPAKRAKK